VGRVRGARQRARLNENYRRPQSIAAAVAFSVTDEAGYINGHTLPRP
jgi:NAD(P)-dependent dehydrogenase (short-subunit alcohol dehydrogenase family)